MRVCIFHPVRLPPKDYGGIERVVLWLACALRDFGMEVSVAASEGSILPEGVRFIPIKNPHQAGASHFHQLMKHQQDFDLVHLMTPVDQGLLDAFQVPTLFTLHGNETDVKRLPRHTVGLSKNHALRHGLQDFCYNGVDPAEFIFNPRRLREQKEETPFLFFSKPSLKTKNLSFAMKICHQTHYPLLIAGGWRPWSKVIQSYFWGFDWFGPANGSQKAALFSRSRGLIFPVNWEEPFGLVMIEALLSGVPVFGSNRGSLPEILNEQVGRAIALDQEDQWHQALSNSSQFAPEVCRDYALKNFSHWKMAENYLKLYQARLASS